MHSQLVKDPKIEYDKEAIKVMMSPLGQIGSVANSPYTVLGDTMSAGRLYDKIGKKAKAKVVMVTEHGTICKICKKSLLDQPVKKEVIVKVKKEMEMQVDPIELVDVEVDDELSFT